MPYTPSEMVGTKRTGIRNIDGRNARTITTSHVERLNGTQRMFMKRLNRLTLCFSKKLKNLEAAFAMFAACYNYCWQTRMPETLANETTDRRDDGQDCRSPMEFRRIVRDSVKNCLPALKQSDTKRLVKNLQSR